MKMLRKRKFVEYDKPKKPTYKFFKPKKEKITKIKKKIKRKNIDMIDHIMITRRKASGKKRKRI